MTAGLLPGVIFLTVTGCLVLGEPLRRVSMVDCSQPIGCTNSVPSTCFFSPECRKRPIKSGSDIILGRKREVDCSKPAYCDRCIPVSCYFDPECKNIESSVSPRCPCSNPCMMTPHCSTKPRHQE